MAHLFITLFISRGDPQCFTEYTGKSTKNEFKKANKQKHTENKKNKKMQTENNKNNKSKQAKKLK